MQFNFKLNLMSISKLCRILDKNDNYSTSQSSLGKASIDREIELFPTIPIKGYLEQNFGHHSSSFGALIIDINENKPS